MKISIIIATYNASKTLKTCLDSIVPQLCTEAELIIVDGASKDNTNDIIKSFGDNVSVHISEPDKGIYDAWNKGVALSHGEWVMFIGADDILLSNAVSTYLNTIKNTADIDSYDYICAHNEYVNEEGKQKHHDHGNNHDNDLMGCYRDGTDMDRIVLERIWEAA